MGKYVWRIEATSQDLAEADGREPCTHCVPNVGTATLTAVVRRRTAG